MDYDVLISDINHEKLRGEVADTISIQYHAEATQEDANKVVEISDCYIYGRKFRYSQQLLVMVPRPIGVFIVDSGSPLTYLSAQVSAKYSRHVTSSISPRKKLDQLTSRSPDTTTRFTGHLTTYTPPGLISLVWISSTYITFLNGMTSREPGRSGFFGRDWELPVKKSKL